MTEIMAREAIRAAADRRPAALAAAVALTVTVLAAYSAPPTAIAASVRDGVWSFVSEPVLDPAAIRVLVGPPVAPTQVSGAPTVSAQPGQAARYVFLALIKNYEKHAAFLGAPGPEIIEADGSPIWEHPLGEPIEVGNVRYERVAMDFHPATYAGQRVLVWWEGYITPDGFGRGTWEIVNDHYQAVGQVNAPAGFELDFHDIQITPAGTAYIIANRTLPLSLSCCGGPANGHIYDQELVEVDISTGRVLWTWDALQHVRLHESEVALPREGPWDPYHLNSISFTSAGNPIVSARDTSAVYWINRRSSVDNGRILATLGGEHSTFTLGPGADFAWQHDVLQQHGDEISLFDDEAVPAEAKQSRGLLLALNFAHHTATLVHEYLLPKPALTGSQGSVELLPDGNVFVGWGQLPLFSEYTAAGTLLYEGELPGADESYRASDASWIGLPTTKPALAVEGGTERATLYASWNGATQVQSWRALAGPRPNALAATGSAVPRQGYETTLQTTDRGPYFAAQALSSSGHVLGTSPAVAVLGKAARSPSGLSAKRSSSTNKS
jgi:hypothetical protein